MARGGGARDAAAATSMVVVSRGSCNLSVRTIGVQFLLMSCGLLLLPSILCVWFRKHTLCNGLYVCRCCSCFLLLELRLVRHNCCCCCIDFSISVIFIFEFFRIQKD